MTDDDHFKRYGRDADVTIYVVGKPGMNRTARARAMRRLDPVKNYGGVRYFTGMFDHELAGGGVIIGGINEVLDEDMPDVAPSLVTAADLKRHLHTGSEGTRQATTTAPIALPDIGDIIRPKAEFEHIYTGFSPDKIFVVTQIGTTILAAPRKAVGMAGYYTIRRENLDQFEWVDPTAQAMVIKPDITAADAEAFRKAWGSIGCVIPKGGEAKFLWAGDMGEITVTGPTDLQAAKAAETIDKIRKILAEVLEPAAPI